MKDWAITTPWTVLNKSSGMLFPNHEQHIAVWQNRKEAEWFASLHPRTLERAVPVPFTGKF